MRNCNATPSSALYHCILPKKHDGAHRNTSGKAWENREHGHDPNKGRCRSCRGKATHWFRTGATDAQDGRRRQRNKSKRQSGNGYAICLDCAKFWNQHGVYGFIVEIGHG